MRRFRAKSERRVSFKLSENADAELSAIAKRRQFTKTETIRLALGLIKLVIENIERGRKITIMTADYILPGIFQTA